MKEFNKRMAVTVSLLRGVLLLVAGVLAMAFPETALRISVVAGGCLLIVDGVLGAIASRNYGPAAPWPFWLSVTRGGLAVLAGLALLFSQFIVSVVQPAFLATCIGVGAIAVGLLEFYILLRYPKEYPPVWSTVTAAVLYIAFGVLLLLLPMSGALVIMRIGGALVALFGAVLLVRAWTTSNRALGSRAA